MRGDRRILDGGSLPMGRRSTVRGGPNECGVDGGSAVAAGNRRSGSSWKEAEVTMFQKSAVRAVQRRPVSPTRRCLLWTITVLDVAAVVWMGVYGAWLDTVSALTSVITLGGNHWLVLGLALAGFLVLAGLAPVTEGFGSASRREEVLLGVAGVVSAVAMAGVLALGVLVGLVLLVLAVASGRAPTWVNVFRW
jgi:hypothetical protein